MGERERNQAYYDRNEGRNENASNRDQQQHEQHDRDWNRDEYRRAQGSEPGNYYERNYGQQDRGQDERNFGARNSSYESRNYSGSQGRFGSQDEQRHDRDWERTRRFEHENSQGYNQSHNQGYGSQAQRSWQGGGYEQRSQPYGYDRNYAREYLGGSYGQGLYEGADWGRIPTQSPRYAQRDWNSSGGGYGYGQERDIRGEQRGRDDESFGQQLRDVSQQVARKVKRVFRGPKGYKRSDERIREDLNDRLAQQQQLDPSDIEVHVANSEVTLTGSVQSRHEKFLAEEIADDIGGVNEIHNQLRVRRDQHQGQSQVSGTETTQAVNQNANDATRRTASRS